MSYFNINEIENKMKCFKTIKDLNNACKMCGINYFRKNAIINNITYINCYEYKEGYYFDDDILSYKLCYFSCKKCNKSGNETEHNCIECKEEYKFELNFSIYKNCFIDNKDLYTSINILTQSSLNTFINSEITEEIESKKLLTNQLTNIKYSSSYLYYHNTYKLLTDIKSELEI